jgi:6-phosphogluconate dehydrogenase
MHAPTLLYDHNTVEELKTGFRHLRKVARKVTEANAVIPSISATLEYLKCYENLALPTQFYEAELDYLGKHKYDKKGEGPGEPVKGKYHSEWKPA